MKNVLKKRKPTVASYFESESQRKKTSRLSFIYGSPRLVAIISVLVIASGVTGFVILQKSRDSKAAVRYDAWSIQASPESPLALYTPQWSVQGGGAGTNQTTPHPLLLSFPAGHPRTAGQKTCWAYAIPGDVTVTQIAFNLTANSAGSTGVTTEYLAPNGVPQILYGPDYAAIQGVKAANVPSPQPGGYARVCIEMRAGAPANSKLELARSAYVNGVNFTGTKAVQVADPAPPSDVKIIGRIIDSNNQPISGVKISNCQTNPAAVSNSGGYIEFTVKQNTAFCVRTQEGLDPAKYKDVKATNTAKSPLSPDGASYESQKATGTQMDGYRFTANLKPATTTPTSGNTGNAGSATTGGCSNTGSGNDTFVEAEKAGCATGVKVQDDSSASGSKSALLETNGQTVEYTLKAPSAGTYQAVAKIRNQTSTQGKVNFEFIKLTAGKPSEVKEETGKLISSTTYTSYTPRDTSTRALPYIHTLAAGQQVILRIRVQGDPNVLVDQLSITKTNEAAPTPSTPDPGNTGNAGSATAQVEILGTVRDNSGNKKPIANVTISNCISTTKTDVNGQYRFMVNKGATFCMRTQEGLDPNIYKDVRVANTSKSGVTADSVTYERQVAEGTRMTNYDFTARFKASVATDPATGNTGNAGQAVNPDTAKRCQNDATGERSIEAESGLCVPNTVNPAKVIVDGDLKVVSLNQNGQYVEFDFKNNKVPGRYRAQAIAKLTGTGNAAYLEYQVIKNLPIRPDVVTKEANATVSRTYTTWNMKNDSNYQNLSQAEINAGASLKVRLIYHSRDGVSGTNPLKIYIDKITLDRVSTPSAAPSPVVAAPPRTSSNTSSSPSGSNSGSSTPSTTTRSTTTTSSLTPQQRAAQQRNAGQEARDTSSPETSRSSGQPRILGGLVTALLDRDTSTEPVRSERSILDSARCQGSRIPLVGYVFEDYCH